MLAIGDLYLYAESFEPTLRFWHEGLQMELIEREDSESVSFAALEFPDGGPALRILSGPGVTDAANDGALFDLLTDDFDAALVRMLDHGGQQSGEIEKYNELRMVTIADPAGNHFDLIEVAEEDIEPNE